MENEKLHREILQRLSVIETKQDDGFKGVYYRQDRTNGNVIKHEKQIRELQDWRLTTKTKVAMIASFMSAIVSVVAFILSKFL